MPDKTIDQRLTERADKLNKAHPDDHPDIRLMREAATIIQTLQDEVDDLRNLQEKLYIQPLMEWAEKQSWYDGELDHGEGMRRLVNEHALLVSQLLEEGLQHTYCQEDLIKAQAKLTDLEARVARLNDSVHITWDEHGTRLVNGVPKP